MRTLSYLIQPLLMALFALSVVAFIATFAGVGSAYLTILEHLGTCDRSAPVSCVAERSTIEE